MPAPTPGLLLITVATLFLPGIVVALGAGLRVPAAVAAAPLVTYGLTTATSAAATVVSFAWSPWVLAVEAATLGGVLWAVRSRGRTAGPRLLRRPSPGDLLVAAGVAAGSALSMGVFLAGMGGVDRANQDWDYSFHANATRFIADSGDLAPSALRAVNDWESTSFFYPNAYHGVAALVRDLTGAPVFSVLNAHTALLGALAAGGLAVLLRQLGVPTAVTATTPVLMACFAAFPYDLVWRGPLLPYVTGVALVPAFLLLVSALVRDPGTGTVVLVGLGGAALFGLQPATALSAAAFALLMLAQRWLAARRVPWGELRALSLAGALVLLLSAPAIVGSVRAGTGGGSVDWATEGTGWQVVGRLLLLGHEKSGPQVWLAVLVAAGVVGLRTARPLWWWAAGTAVAVLLFVLAAASDGALAAALTRPWWNDAWRLLGVAALGMAPLAAHGACELARLVARRTARPAAVAAVLAGVVVLTGGLYTPGNTGRVASAYQSDRHLDADEVAAMAWLSRRVPPGEVVMNDPRDGSPFMAALEGIRPVFGHQVPKATYAALGPTRRTLLDRFHCLDTDPDVRSAIEQLGIRYLFLGSGYVRRHAHRAPGLVGVSDSPSLDLVHAHGGVRIYRIDLQPLSDQPIPACSDPAAEDAPS